MDKVPKDLDHLTKLENHMPFSSLTTLDGMVSREYNFVFVAVPEFFSLQTLSCIILKSATLKDFKKAGKINKWLQYNFLGNTYLHTN